MHWNCCIWQGHNSAVMLHVDHLNGNMNDSIKDIMNGSQKPNLYNIQFFIMHSF